MATTRKATRSMGARKMAAAGERGGFTIIEVVLVLAIAGLIFLMVFIALPALQRSQRDTQRRSNMGRLETAVTDYQANNNGRLPADGAVVAAEENTGAIKFTGATSVYGSTSNSAVKLVREYLNGINADENKFTDPSGHAYGITICTFGGGSTTNTCNATYLSNAGVVSKQSFDDHMALVVKHAKCGDDNVAVYSPNARDYAIMLKLEGSGTYCQANSN